MGSVRSIPLNSNGSERWIIPQNLTDPQAKGKGTSDLDGGGSVRPVKGRGIGIGKGEDGTGTGRDGKEKDSQRALGGWIRRRGRWYKIVVLGILVVGLIVGLAVGLTIGLRKRYLLLPFCSPGSRLYHKGFPESHQNRY